jgi:outer membrane protein
MRPMRSVWMVAAVAAAAHAQQPQQTRSASTEVRAGSLTLDDAIAIAQRNNPLYLQVRNNLRSANAQVRQAYGALLPSSNASFRTGFQQGGTQYVQGIALPGSSDSYQSSYSIGLSYSVAPSMAYAPRAARATRDASEADITSSAENLRSQVTAQYITALQSEAQAAVLDTLVQSAAGQLDLVNAKMAVGAATIVDVRTAEVSLGQAQVQALTVHNNSQVDKLRLFQLMGVPADITVRLTTQFPIAQPAFSLDSLITLARRVNPDLAAKKLREQASELQVKVARSQYLPSLFLSTGYGAQAFGYTNADLLAASAQAQAASSFRNCMVTDSLRIGAGLKALPCGPATLSNEQLSAVRASNQPFKFNKAPYGIGASLQLPLFNNFQREANIEQQRVARDNALYDVRARNLQINTDVTQAYLTLVTDARNVELQNSIAQKASEDLAGAQERYKVGAATFLDVTVARGTYEKAQIDRVNSVYEYHKAFAALENAVGRPLR